MAQFFAYIAHHNGVLGDSAAEPAVAAAQIDETAGVTAIVTGDGAALDAACRETARIYPVVWRFEHPDLTHPNAEKIRKLLLKVLPADGIVLLAHDTFGMDLGPGLSIKLDSAYAADVVGIESIADGTATLMRQEFSGMTHTHVRCDISRGAVLSLRPGAFQPEGSSGGISGRVEDKSGDIGDLAVRRNFIEVVEAEAGDVDITKSDVLVSIGRDIEDQENIQLAEALAAAILLMSREKADHLGLIPIARVKAWASGGLDPAYMGLGAVSAAKKILDQEKLHMSDFGTIELNEAFAVQALACLRELDCDPETTNPLGGGISIGHPIGCTGARIVFSLAKQLKRKEQSLGLASLCIGGGQGMAVVLENV